MDKTQNRYLAIGYTETVPFRFSFGQKRKKAIEFIIQHLKDKCEESIRLGMEEKGIKGVNLNGIQYGVKTGWRKVTVAARLVIPRLAYQVKTNNNKRLYS